MERYKFYESSCKDFRRRTQLQLGIRVHLIEFHNEFTIFSKFVDFLLENFISSMQTNNFVVEICID